MKKKGQLELLFLYLIICFFLYLVLLTVGRVMESSETIEICKELGYDGAKFKSDFSVEMECSNKTEIEKYKENKSWRKK